MSIRLAASLLVLVGSPAVAATVATPATLAERLANATPGETIQLAPGTYDAPLEIKGRHWSPPVTVDASAAQLRTVRVDDVSGLTWHGGTFDGADTERNGINVNVADHLVIDGVTFHHYLRNGIGLGIVSDARITNNAITDSGSDGIDVAMSRRIVLDHNRCTDSHPTPGAHPDCIQLWSHAVQPPTADIVLTNNEVIGDTQGFTAFNHTSPDATGKVVDDGGFDRITVENNYAKVSSYHGVTLYDCRHCIIRNNRAESLPNPQYPRSRAWIKALRSTDLTMCGNVAVDYPRDPGQHRCSADEAARKNTP